MRDMTSDMESIQTILDNYEKNLGLNLSYNSEKFSDINDYLNMDRTVINKLMPEDCGEISYRLSQMSFFIQRAINKEQSQLTWATGRLNDIISQNLQTYDKYMKHDTKVCLICKTNIQANKLQQIIRYAQQITDRLNFYTTGLNNLSRSIENIGRAKVNAKKG